MSTLYSPPVLKDKILTNISAAIREIHRLTVTDNEPRILTNDDWQVHCLLEHLDFALLYGLKNVQNGYYKCVSEFTPKLLLQQIDSLLNLETDIGRGRAWFFFAFNDSLVESYIKCFQDNKKLIKKFYTSDSIVNDSQRLIALTTLCSGLETIQFDLKSDCVYFDRSCWPAYLQVNLNDAEKLSLPGIKHDVPSFTTYLSRYHIHHIPTSPETLQNATVASRRVRVPKHIRRTSTESSVVNSFISSDIHPTTLSRSSSVSYDNPSIDGSSLNDENQQITNSKSINIDLNLPTLQDTTEKLSTSLSELDPMLNGRIRTPSPISSTLTNEQNLTLPTDEDSIVTETIEESIKSTPALLSSMDNGLNELSIERKSTPSLSSSIDNGLNELSIENKNDDLLNLKHEDSLDLPADANLLLQFTLEIYEIPNREDFIKLFPTTNGHNNGNIEVIFVLISTINVYLLRLIRSMNNSYRIEKVESIRLESIDYIETGPNEEFFRIITVKHKKLLNLTTGSTELTRAICNSICETSKIGRFPEPQILPATMQEISIKKELARDMKKTNPNEVKILDYHYVFWEEPQMSGRVLRKEGFLLLKLVESPSPFKRISGATLKSAQRPFETWRNAYVTLRADCLDIFLQKSDQTPKLSFTLRDENCQGCRRNRNAERSHVIEIMFAHDLRLLIASKGKAEQDEWLNAIMKGLSQGHMTIKDEDTTENTVPCSLILTEDKIYLTQDEHENSVIRHLDSTKLEYIVQLFVDSECPYYCVLSIEHGNQNSKSWIFYFLFAKEMIRFVKTLQNALTNVYQVPIDVHPLTDTSFQRECVRTFKRLLRTYRPLKLIP